ncbi:Phosphotransferase KptA/Tpt1 [Kalmanozyma brasiliensis GHG001]|uniref:2'-phosphotransferase n=1 Tax=Kalmanozyma brasiliensis (strain GHG001) TaxID=1365824 RepID=V5ETK9_KALBG|nr:Phosphotransferase KptA/Tpt1 [Kalmanozyma brasiliensis GHG001]EST08590.1 Phosphotransferase KptA/Tpt1 [Kalmanozyma brasiliensis GHG001]
MSSEPPTVVAQQPQASTSSADPPVNPERKARKEAAKQLKAQQSADKKAAAAAARASQASSSKPKPDKAQRKPQSSEEQLSRGLAYILRHGAEKEGLAIRNDGYIRLEDVLDRPRVKSVDMAEGEGGKRRPGLEDVRKIVESNDKKRFELTEEEQGEWWVRAVQGHSLKSVVELQHVPLTLDNLYLLSVRQQDEEDEDDGLVDEVDAKLGGLQIDGEHDASKTGPVQVIHGTYTAAWESILESGGLKPMSRNHIHLSKGKFGDKGVISGMRKSANRLIYIDIERAIQDGIEFVLSSNGVVLTPGDKESRLLGSKYFDKVEDQKGNTVWSPSSTTS